MSVYISSLPVYTGTAADLRWFVMNNSGETTTYKFSGYPSQLIVGTGINFPYRTLNATASGNDSIAIGDIAQATGTFNIAMGYNARATIGNGSVAVGWDTIVGDSHAAVGGSHNATGGEGATLGYNNENTGNQSVSIGTLNNMGGGISIGIGANNTDNSNNRIAMIGGSNNLGSAWSVALGYNNTLVGFNFSTESVLIGYGNTINGSGVNTGNVNIGQSQTISDGSYNTILNGKSNALQGGYYNTILNGSGNTLSSSYSGVSMLSCFGRTASASNTTYVENIHSYRTPSTQVQSVVSGTTFTCNLELGAKSQFYITGTSTINITNVRDGASFMIKTQTDGNYIMTWTATGYTFVFEGGIKDPGNTTTDIFVFEVFGSVIYGSRRHNFS